MTLKRKIVLVFLTSTLIPFIIIGTLTYIDFQRLAREAGLPPAELGYQLVFFIALLLLFVLLIGSLMSQVIVKPIIKLSTTTALIRQGDLSARAAVSGKDEIGKLAADFNAMARGLQEIDQEKTELTAMISHQLRTPSTAIQGAMATLLDYYSKSLTPDQKKLIKTAYDENEKMQVLIDRILDVVQISAADLRLEKSNLALGGLAKEAVANLSSQLKMRSQKATIKKPGKPVLVRGNRDKLLILIENLVSNACKYSPDNTEITIAIEPDGNYGALKVTDQGFGIAKKDYGRIFTMFARLDNPNAGKVAGSGLGLYLVKKIVEAHEGEILVDSTPGKGTTFTVRLPRAT